MKAHGQAPTPAERTSGALHAAGPEQRTVWGRLWRYLLAPPFYWLDLLDAQRRPSHSKLTWTVAFGMMFGLLIFSARQIFLDSDKPSPTELTFLLGFASLAAALAGGLDGYKSWLKTRGGGTLDAFEAALKAASPDGREKADG